MTGYDVTTLDPVSDVVISHADGTLETDGPWLIVRGDDGQVLAVRAAHVVVAVDACDGVCRAVAFAEAAARHQGISPQDRRGGTAGSDAPPASTRDVPTDTGR